MMILKEQNLKHAKEVKSSIYHFVLPTKHVFALKMHVLKSK